MLTYVFVKSCIDLADPANSESGNSWFGIGPPLSSAASPVLGVVLMIGWRLSAPAFFRRRLETADPALLATPPAAPTG